MGSYTWIAPKTDWGGEAVSYTDYNRIRNNLLYLHYKADELFPPEADAPGLGGEKNVGDWYFASEFNAFEDELENINSRTFSYDIGQKQTFFALGKWIGYEELNRIEGAMLRIYAAFSQIETMSRRTSFRAGGADFLEE